MYPPILWLLNHPLFWAAFAVLSGPVFFVRGFRALQCKKLILGTPVINRSRRSPGAGGVRGKAVVP